MDRKTPPSPDVLRQLLRYEPETGKLFWLSRPVESFPRSFHRREVYWAAWETRYAGKEAFTATAINGHKVGIVLKQKFSAHRVIWAMQAGEWPSEQIDHVNNDPADNRWSNLRLATSSQNACNRKRSASNTSGFKGVSWHKRDQKWQANIRKSGKSYFLGLYASPELAHAAYLRASLQLHGEFRRAG